MVDCESSSKSLYLQERRYKPGAKTSLCFGLCTCRTVGLKEARLKRNDAHNVRTRKTDPKDRVDA